VNRVVRLTPAEQARGKRLVTSRVVKLSAGPVVRLSDADRAAVAFARGDFSWPERQAKATPVVRLSDVPVRVVRVAVPKGRPRPPVKL
jgi:hypothetical protein